MHQNRYEELLDRSLEPQAFVREAIELLEGSFREVALAALSSWQRLGVRSARLAESVLAQPDPTGEACGDFLFSLRHAAAQILESGTTEERASLDEALAIRRLLAMWNEKLDPALLEALAPLFGWLPEPVPDEPVLGEVLALSVSLGRWLRSDAPTEPAEWKRVSLLLRPLIELHAHQEPCRAVVSLWDRHLSGPSALWPAPTRALPASAEASPLPTYTPGEPPEDSTRRPVASAEGPTERPGGSDLERLLRQSSLGLRPGVLLGDYLVAEPLAEGGFATVHIGVQLSTGRKIAIKILRDGMPREVQKRFQQEASYLAQFNHPNIVIVYGYGEERWSVPSQFVDALADEDWFLVFSKGATVKSYIALEWVDGRSLKQITDAVLAGTEPMPSIRQSAEWFAQAASALVAVHGLGLIHRDVKPSNLMIQQDGHLVLMDFGIARSQHEQHTLVTGPGQVFGTPGYMSPEQTRSGLGGEVPIGPPSDIYSLGATFYELFTLSRIYRHDGATAEAAHVRRMNGELPAAPRSLRKDLPPELETILMGGLQLHVKDRYHSMDALSRDVRHYLNDEPIEYRPPSMARRLVLGYRRNRPVVHLLAVFGILLVGGTSQYIHDVDHQRLVAEAAAQRAEQQRAVAEDGARRLAAREADLQRQILRLFEEQGRQELLRSSPRRAMAYLAEVYRQDRSSLAARFLIGMAVRPLDLDATRRTLRGHADKVTSVRYSEDGRFLVTASLDGTARVWDVASGRTLATLSGHRAEVLAAALSPGGRRVVTASQDGSSRVWDVASGSLLFTLDEGAPAIVHSGFSTDGARILTVPQEGPPRVWAAQDGRLLAELKGHEGSVLHAELSPGGQRIVTAGDDQTARVWDARDGRLLLTLEGHSNDVYGASFDPSGTRVVTAGWDGTTKVWDAYTGQRLVSLAENTVVVRTARFDRTGHRVVSARLDGTAVWDLRTSRLLSSFMGHDAAVTGALFSPDGKHVLTTSRDNVAKLWDAASGRLLASLHESDPDVASAAFSPDGRGIATGGMDGTVDLWDVTSTPLFLPIGEHDDDVSSAAFSPDGRALVTTSWDRTARVWDAETGEGRAVLSGHRGAPRSAVFSPDGTRILTAGWDGTAKLWDAAAGLELMPLGSGAAGIQSASFAPDGQRMLVVASRVAGGDQRLSAVFSPDGSRLASTGAGWEASVYDAAEGRLQASLSADALPEAMAATLGRQVALWDVATGKLQRVLEHPADVVFLGFSPDGGSLLSSAADGISRLWLLQGPTPPTHLQGHRAPLASAVFSPDGRHLAAPGSDGLARVWDLPAGELSLSLQHRDEVVWVAFSPDGQLVATASWDGTAKVWEVETGQLLASLEGSGGEVYSAVFSPDGQRLVTTGAERAARLWDVHLEARPPAEIARLVHCHAGWRLDQGRLLPVAAQPEDCRAAR
jgi:WD40 repeat protein/serine/threonine protein kinase